MRVTQAAVQKETFPLAGLLVNVMVQSLKEPVISRPITGSENLTKPDAVEYFSTINRTGGNLCLTDAREEFSGTLGGTYVSSTRGEFKDTLRHFATGTGKGSIEFSESIKKGSTANATLCRDAGNNQALGSMPDRSNSLRPSVLSQLPRLIPAADATASNCALSSGVIRIWKVGDFPEDECLMSRLIVDMYVPTKLALLQSGTYPNILKPEKETPLNGITSTRQGLTTTVNTTNEEAVMDITTHPQGRESFGLNSGHQHRHFVWIIAAVRRDNPALSPVLHHIAAENEREARRTLAKDNVCFFAGRLPVQEARHA